MDWEKNPPFGIGTDAVLRKTFEEHCTVELAPINLQPRFSQQRIHDIFGAWKEDLERSEKGNFINGSISPGHIKAAAHLTYWIRREAPIVHLETSVGPLCQEPSSGTMYDPFETIRIELEVAEDSAILSDEEATKHVLPGGMTLAEFQNNRNRIFKYGNELIAFTFGFSLAKAYEEQKHKEQGRSFIVALPSGAFIDDLCYFLKFKSVSPHSLDLIYRALLSVPA